MIVEENLSPVRVVQYTARPLACAIAWAVAVLAVYLVTMSILTTRKDSP